MADYYIDAQNGDDANDGDSPAEPIQTLNEGFNLRLYGYNDDDTIHLSGTFSGDLATAVESIIKVLTPGQRVTIKQWAGMPQAIIRGDVEIPNGSWTYGGSAGVFTYTFASGYFDYANNRTLPEAIASVVVNWDTVVDARGINSGHLRRAQSNADCSTRVNSWWFEPSGTAGVNQTGGGVLKINVGTTAGGTDASLTSTGALTSAGLTVAYVRANRNGIEIGNPTYQDNVFTPGDFATNNPSGTRYLTIDGLYVYLFSDGGWRTQFNGGGTGIDVGGSTIGTRSIGYGIRVADGLYSVVKNCVTRDTGYHGIMFVGDLCQNNTMMDCTMYGGGLNPLSGNSIGGAFYTGNSGSGDKNISGCKAYRCTVYQYTHMGRELETVSSSTYAIPIQFPFTSAGASTYTTCNTDGFISHTNAAVGNRVLDVEYHDCNVIAYYKMSDGSMCLGSAFIVNGVGDGSSPSDPMDPSDYPVRFYDCTFTDGCYNETSSDCNVAYSRCKFVMSRAGSQRGSGTGVMGSQSGSQSILYDACEVFLNLDHASSARNGFQCSTSNKIYHRNVSVYVNGTATNAQRIFNFINGSTGSTVKARGCIYGFRSNKSSWELLTMGTSPSGTTLNETNFDMNDCFYFNITVPCGFPGPNTMSEWINGGGDWASGASGAAIDQDAVNNGTTNPFAGGATATDLSLTAAAKAIKKTLVIRSDYGINLLAYSSNYGAWQYGGNTYRSSFRSARTRPILSVR